MRRLPTLLCTLLLAFQFGGAVQSSPIELSDLSRLRLIESVDVASDGSAAVCEVRESHRGPSGTTSFVRRLWLVDLLHDDRDPIPLTSGLRDDRQPVFSPDSKRIAFYRLDADGLHQPCVIRLEGGEPFRLQNPDHGVDLDVPPAWSPDGTSLLVTGWVEPDARGMSDGRSPRRRGLWLLDASGVERESPGPLLGFPDCGEGVFAGDGRTIYCTVVLPEEPEPGQSHRTAIGRIGVSVGVCGTESDLPVRGVVTVNNQIITFEDADFDLDSPRISPSGEVVAVLGRSRRSPFFDPVRLGLLETDAVDGQSPEWLTGSSGFDRSIENFQWRTGQDSILLTAMDDGGIDLLTISQTLLSQPRVLATHEGDLPTGITSFSSGGGAVYMARTSVDAPSGLWELDAGGQKQCWDPNPWVRDRTLSVPEADWVTPRGEDPIPYWLSSPPDRRDDQDIPIVLWLGSGPGSMIGPGVRSDWFSTQLLAANGFAVLQVNPRGSGGYGRDSLRRIYRDFVRGPSRDVLAVLQHVRQQDQRMGSGGRGLIASSIGAMIGAWTIVADQQFDAAIFEDGVFSVPIHIAEHPDWMSMLDLLGGVPQDPGVVSVVRDIDLAGHVDRIKTPVLLMTGSTGGHASVLATKYLHRMLTLGFKAVDLVEYRMRSGGLTLKEELDRHGRMLQYLQDHVQGP
ncbi:MAG: prolyl oligopeptidase family serine peptidase [Phycisphaerales bacterium]|nr:prolyl oligopeptidase family serine peptidase [Phycisphaerales bacterium]